MAPCVDEGLLQRMQAAVRRGQPLDGRQAAAEDVGHEGAAGAQRPVVDQDGAGPADADAAAALGAGQVQVLAQERQEVLAPVAAADAHAAAVDDEGGTAAAVFISTLPMGSSKRLCPVAW